MRKIFVALLAGMGVLAGCDAARQNPQDAGAETAQADCTRCHGTGDDPAPPRSVRGDTATTSLAVGAHQAHLADGPLHRGFACAECHVVPTSTRHMDGEARVTFGPLASAGAGEPSWDRASATCATYCHGTTLGGGANRAPIWTKVDGTQAACGACHGAPPPAPHPASAACASCHPGYTATTVNVDLHVNGRTDLTAGGVAGACGSCHGLPPAAPHPQNASCGRCHDGYTNATVNAALHMNGAADVLALDCASCHGDRTRTTFDAAAPPADASGNRATTARGVGAHEKHLRAGALGPAVACAECHAVPSSPAHANGVVEVALGARSRAGGATPAWDPAALTCATYCHGATLPGGGAKQPVWTKVDGSQTTCGSCHGAPPPAPHPQNAACGACHPGYTATTVNAALHLDGTVQAPTLSCTSCHGDAARATAPEAPPRDTKGNTATTARGVGAHQAHLASGALAAPLACTECHVLPTGTHPDGAVQVTLGARARQGGVAAAWNPTALTCTTYCHGATLSGGSARAPLWTRVDGTQKTCSSCHGAPPSTGQHGRSEHRVACGTCHSGYGSTAVNASIHLNGAKDVGGSGTRINSWNASTRTCAPACHGSERW